MKILTFTAFYPPHHMGGYELRCRDVLEGLRHAGHEILLITNSCTIQDCQEHINEPWISRILNLQPEGENFLDRIQFDNAELTKIQQTITNFKPDLIYLWHLQNLSDAILPFLASQSLPMVYDEGGSEMIYFSRLQKRGLYFYKNEQDSTIKKWLKCAIKAYASIVSRGKIVPDWEWPEQMRIYFNSRSSLEHALDLGAQVENASIILSGFDILKFPFKERTQINEPVKIVIPARIKRQKGCEDGIQLVKELNQRNIRSQLLIIGEVQSKDYYDELNKTTNDLSLGDKVEIQPMMSQVELGEIYRSSDFCFFPSYFKTGFSRVPLEAMASGCLVITYGNEGSNESVQHGETGIIVKEGDISSAADWVLKLMQENSQFRIIVENARQKVEQDYTMESYLRKVEVFLENSLPGRNI